VQLLKNPTSTLYAHKLANYKELAKELCPSHDKSKVRFPTEGGSVANKSFVLFCFSFQRKVEELD
jgi:hypothetical protein